MFLYPDNPVDVSVDFLKRLDAEKTCTWYGQAKLDGWRRMAVFQGGKWTWRAKPSGSGGMKELPAALREEFEGLTWPDGIGLDMEWVGNRMVENKPVHSLYVFDVFMLDGVLCDWPAWRRMNLVGGWRSFSKAPNVHFVDAMANKGLMDLFAQQICNPLSEGIVVRRHDQKIKGNPSKCVDGQHIYKIKYRDVRELKGAK